MIRAAIHRRFSIPLIAMLATCVISPAGAAETPERVALLIADMASPKGTCKLRTLKKTLETLRFAVGSTAGVRIAADTKAFAERSTKAEAAIIYACNPASRENLPHALNASKLNFLFLLETSPAEHGVPFTKLLKTERDNLMIIHVRIATPENDEIFARTLNHKLRRLYSPPDDIISRTIVSSYYESRGTMLIDLQGKVASSYILARPPVEEIIDAWSRVQDTSDRKALEEFIAKYPKTLFADLARSRLEKVKGD